MRFFDNSLQLKGPINWFVFDWVGEMSRRFILEFREEVLENNNRPLQDRKDRPIYFTDGLANERKATKWISFKST